MKSLHLAEFPIVLAAVLTLHVFLEACTPKPSYYSLVEDSLRAGDAEAADRVVREADDEYGSKSRVLYGMDRGMTLHLAGHYRASNAQLEKADEEVERLYTRRVSTELAAFLVNDTQLPFEGQPFEQVLINVVKAINYAMLREWDEALVEARRADHRLNVLADRVDDDAYHDEPVARYLSGVLYDVAGDVNNAFIAYRNAYEGYRAARAWARTPVPRMLKADLLRVTDALHMTQEHATYAREFPDVAWKSAKELRNLAQVIVISYNGRAPRLEDQFVDLPISSDALKLVVLTKSVPVSGDDGGRRAAESVLYGLNGRVVRVALPKLVPQRTEVAFSRVTLSGPAGRRESTSELISDLTATAEKALDDRFAEVALKAVTRAATKFALAEGVQYGAGRAGGNDAGPILALLIGIFAKSLAVATEEADKRSWRTLPDQIQLARLWVQPGTYELRVRAMNAHGQPQHEARHAVTLRAGEARFVVERVLQ